MQNWTKLNKLEQTWTNLNKIEQTWTKLNKIEQTWTNLNKIKNQKLLGLLHSQNLLYFNILFVARAHAINLQFRFFYLHKCQLLSILQNIKTTNMDKKSQEDKKCSSRGVVQLCCEFVHMPHGEIDICRYVIRVFKIWSRIWIWQDSGLKNISYRLCYIPTWFQWCFYFSLKIGH